MRHATSFDPTDPTFFGQVSFELGATETILRIPYPLDREDALWILATAHAVLNRDRFDVEEDEDAEVSRTAQLHW